MGHKIDDSKESLKLARGERAKLLRTMLRLNRPDLVRKYKIAIGSLQTWEEARYGGLTRKGAERLIEAYEREGLICSMEWLYDGIGPEPTFKQGVFNVSDEEKSQLQTLSKNDDIQQELILFHKHNQNSIDTIIPDDTLAPYLQKGDLVAGVRFFADDLQNAIGMLCIVQTLKGEMITGYLEAEENTQSYSLFNCFHSSKKLIKDGLKLFSAAPVIWIRRNLIY